MFSEITSSYEIHVEEIHCSSDIFMRAVIVHYPIGRYKTWTGLCNVKTQSRWLTREIAFIPRALSRDISTHHDYLGRAESNSIHAIFVTDFWLNELRSTII